MIWQHLLAYRVALLLPPATQYSIFLLKSSLTYLKIIFLIAWGQFILHTTVYLLTDRKRKCACFIITNYY